MGIPALMTRVEPMCDLGIQYYVAVGARADWSIDEIEFTMLGSAESPPKYRIAAYVAHLNDSSCPARQRMRSGHYIAYAKSQGKWYDMNDDEMIELGSPPTRLPYIVFLERIKILSLSFIFKQHHK